MSRSERVELYKIKKHKDLGFLLEIKEQKPVQNIRKYLLQEGTGSVMNDITIPLHVYYNYQKFDYTGKLVIRLENKGFSLPFVPKQNEVEENNICTAVLSMKLQEKSWFNIQLYQNPSEKCAGYNGFHYEITLEKYTYKNDNNYQSKKLIYEENREKAKNFFQKKNYKQALKIYKNSINILKSLSKKFFSTNELKQLGEYCEKSETNYLKCLAKLNGFGGRYDQQIGTIGKQISQKFMKKSPESLNSYYLKAIYLKYESKFADAEEAIKQASKKTFSEDPVAATMEKTALKNLLEEIKKTKERNIRHLRREEIRKKKTEKKIEDVWDLDDADEKSND